MALVPLLSEIETVDVPKNPNRRTERPGIVNVMEEKVIKGD